MVTMMDTGQVCCKFEGQIFFLYEIKIQNIFQECWRGITVTGSFKPSAMLKNCSHLSPLDQMIVHQLLK